MTLTVCRCFIILTMFKSWFFPKAESHEYSRYFDPDPESARHCFLVLSNELPFFASLHIRGYYKNSIKSRANTQLMKAIRLTRIRKIFSKYLNIFDIGYECIHDENL